MTDLTNKIAIALVAILVVVIIALGVWVAFFASCDDLKTYLPLSNAPNRCIQ